MKVRDLLIKLDKPKHLDKELIIASDDEGNRYYGEVSINSKFSHILVINGYVDVELEDYL